MAKEGLLEKHDEDDSKSDGAVGQVEYGRENFARLTAPNGYPFGEVNHFGKMEHIYHVAHEKWSISAAIHHCFAVVHYVVVDLSIVARTCIEDEPVESAIDDISESSGHNERNGNDIAPMRILLDQFVEVPANTGNHYYSKNTESEFTRVARNHPAEGHAWVFYKL